MATVSKVNPREHFMAPLPLPQEELKEKSVTSEEEPSDTLKTVHLWIQRFLYVFFTLFVSASVLVIIVGIYNDYCVLKFNPAALYVILLCALTLLGYVEALHYSNVSVEKWDMSIYTEKYPRACKVQKLVNTNEKVQRFLVGRQFFVIFVVFIIAQVTTLPGLPKDFLGLPESVVAALLGSGIPGIFLVLTFGQLVPQLFVEEFTLQFLNLYGCYFVTQLSFFAEFIGVCNFSWMLFHSVDYLFYGHVAAPANIQINQPGSPTEPVVVQQQMPAAEEAMVDHPVEFAETAPGEDSEIVGIRTGWFDILKHTWSTGVTLGALIIVGYGISKHYSVLPAPVPALYIIFILALSLLFYLEGLMICIVATQYWDPETFKETHPRAYNMHKMINKPDVVKRFIVGRQFFTLVTNFLLAQISVFPVFPSEGYDPVLFFIVVRSGLVGVMITLAFAQLLPELLAARHPLSFMNFYGATTIVNASLFIESLGVGHCAWAFYFATRGFLFGHHLDVPKSVPATEEDYEAGSNVVEMNLAANNNRTIDAGDLHLEIAQAHSHEEV